MRKLIIFLFTFLLLGCSINSSKEEKESTDTKEMKWKEMVKNLSMKHNAIIDWREKFNQRHVYTVELQYHLTQKNQNPIVVEAAVRDIYMNQGRYIIELEDYIGIGSKEIYYELKANVDLVNKILKKSSWIAAIVQVDSINKAVKFGIENLEYEAYLEQNDVLVFHGKCLDVLRYPEN